MVKWLLEDKVFDTETDAMIIEIKRQGFDYVLYNQPCLSGPEAILDLFGPEDCVVFYGSLGMAQQVRRKAPWIPGVYCDLPKFECLHYYPQLGDHLLNKDYVMLPFGDLRRRRSFLVSLFGTKVFVRPSSGFKTFGGKVISAATWEEDIKFLEFYNPDPDKAIVVAPTHIIHAEWRLVVVNGKIIAGSQYIKDDEIQHGPCPEHVMAYGQSVLDATTYRPERAWCLDVCELGVNNLKVLEVGAFSTCGLYATPMESVISEVAKAAEQDWKDINEA